jgi:hypothetical protein
MGENGRKEFKELTDPGARKSRRLEDAGGSSRKKLD